MSTTVKFGFFLKTRTNSMNEQPIVMTINSGYDRTQLFTGIWINKNRWNNKTIKDKIKNGFTNHQGVISSFEKFLQWMEKQIP